MSTSLSPLQQVELEVQARAARTRVDVDAPDGEALLRRLIAEVIDERVDAHRRGLRDDAVPDPDGLAERAFRNLARYGPLTDLLADDDVWEIMVNGPEEIFVRRHSGGSRIHPEVFHDDDHVARTLTKLLEDSATSHRKLDPTEGLQDAQLDDGSRLHIVHGDLSRGNHLMVNIRKFTGVAVRSLDDLVELGTLSSRAARFLATAMRARLSIVFAGAPGSGKTTLLSCCAAELDPTLRVVIAEEVFEADVPIADVASMQTRPARADRAEIDLRRLVAGFLRMAPDVAIVGEVRDREALPRHRYPRSRSTAPVATGAAVGIQTSSSRSGPWARRWTVARPCGQRPIYSVDLRRTRAVRRRWRSPHLPSSACGQCRMVGAPMTGNLRARAL
jgi:pilus assembly protein CpaF